MIETHDNFGKRRDDKEATMTGYALKDLSCLSESVC